jgi:hypothetical protein
MIIMKKIKDNNWKMISGVAAIIVILVVVAIAPIVEVTYYAKDGTVLEHRTVRIFSFGSQSLVPLVPPDAAKAAVNIIQNKVVEYYSCETNEGEAIPTTLEEVRSLCTLEGKNSYSPGFEPK